MRNDRIYRMGRDLAYDCWSADLLLATSSPELYRINLEQVGAQVFCIDVKAAMVNVVCGHSYI